MSETYEGLRDSTSGELGAAWKGADRQAANLSEQYRTLKDDPRYTEEYKAEKAWEAYEEGAPRIQEGREKTREILESEARHHEYMALPRPKGETLLIGSPEKLLAAQNQAARVVRTVERHEKRAEQSPGPFGGRPKTALLKEEYERGLQAGGVEGALVCKGTLMAAEELGIDPDSFLRDLRGPEHVEELEKAQRCRMMAQSMASKIPKPPFKKPHSGRLDSDKSRSGAPWAR